MKRIIQLVMAFVFIFSNETISVYAQRPGDYFKIQVVDKQTGRGVPLVELKLINNILYYTDNNGIIAFYEPGLMEREVFFHIKSHGYEYPADGFGYRGTSLYVSKGDSAIIRIERNNIAERLYRITGQGLYHHSILAGHPVPIKQPALNSKVMGQDTFIETIYRGKLYWFWGDTDRPSYPLGNFSTSGATSELPWEGGLDPSKGIELTYFLDSSGFSKPMCPIPGPGPVWIHWIANIGDEGGAERLIGSYTRVKTLDEAYERGIVIFDDSSEIFKPIATFDLHAPLFPDGHPFRAKVNGEEYLYFSFSTPYTMRVRADLEHISNPASYEAFTCLVKGSKYDKAISKLDRGPDGRLIYSWKPNTQAVSQGQQLELIEAGKITSGEAWIHLQDFESGTPVQSHAGSVYWNEFRKKWIMIFHERGGTSNLGEVWYSEGDTPTGPWVYAKKIVTHDRYSFYNVGQHPMFDQENGRIIYFEGTYTNSFSASPIATPRYNYNQIMYRLDLSDPRLNLPAPVYCIANSSGHPHFHLRESVDSLNSWTTIDNIPFFAIPADRKIEGLIPVFQYKKNGQSKFHLKPSSGKTASRNPIFYGLPLFETKEEKLSGTWKCTADGFPLQMEIMMAKDKINISFNEENLFVTNAEFRNDTIVFTVNDASNEVIHRITASILDGKMNGRGVASGTKESFDWEGERIDLIWKLAASAAVVPMYEYQKENGDYYYSTDPGLQEMKRSEKPICRVWRNPSTILTLDYEAKPVQRIR